MPSVVRPLIEDARRAGTLCCASHDDLLAPYKKRERSNHEKLCRVLGDHYGIPLSLQDFLVKDEIQGEDSVTIRPLVFAEVEGQDRLMVVSCHYVMASGRKPGGGLRFDIDPESVTFHLFEAMDSERNAGDADTGPGLGAEGSRGSSWARGQGSP
jgi:hypothetical protein